MPREYLILKRKLKRYAMAYTIQKPIKQRGRCKNKCKWHKEGTSSCRRQPVLKSVFVVANGPFAAAYV